MQENDKATHAFENVLRLNPHNVQALTQLASICTIQERYQQVCPDEPQFDFFWHSFCRP